MPLPAQQTCGAGAGLLCSIHKLFLHPYYVQAPQGHQESVGGGGGRQGLAPVLEEQTHGGDECVTGASLEKQWDGSSEEVPDSGRGDGNPGRFLGRSGSRSTGRNKGKHTRQRAPHMKK